MRILLVFAAVLLAGCANLPLGNAPLEQCRADTASLNAQLAAAIAERERVTRTASRREEALRRQLDALKAIERSILERDDRVRSETR